jgi:hypothetical protein
MAMIIDRSLTRLNSSKTMASSRRRDDTSRERVQKVRGDSSAANQRLGDAESLPHPTREARERLFAGVPEIDLVEQAVHHVPSLTATTDAFEDGHVFEHLGGGYSGVHTEILRQVSEGATQRLGIREDIEPIESNATRGRNLERGDAWSAPQHRTLKKNGLHRFEYSG